jgi:hypothetical protein
VRASMSKPEPIYLRWRGRDVHIHHDDLLLTRYSPVIATLQSAMTITSEVATLRLVMARERAYDVQVPDDGSEVRLRRGSRDRVSVSDSDGACTMA